jgi:hypothetical protein
VVQHDRVRTDNLETWGRGVLCVTVLNYVAVSGPATCREVHMPAPQGRSPVLGSPADRSRCSRRIVPSSVSGRDSTSFACNTQARGFTTSVRHVQKQLAYYAGEEFLGA